MIWWLKVSFFCSSSGKKSGSILEPFRHNISWRCRVRSDLLNLRFLRELLHGIIYPWKTFCVKGISRLSFKTYFLVIIILFACQVWLLTIGYRLIFLLLGAVYLRWFKTINRISIIPRNWQQTSDVYTQHTSLRTDTRRKTVNGCVCLFVCLLVVSAACIRKEHGQIIIIGEKREDVWTGRITIVWCSRFDLVIIRCWYNKFVQIAPTFTRNSQVGTHNIAMLLISHIVKRNLEQRAPTNTWIDDSFFFLLKHEVAIYNLTSDDQYQSCISGLSC